MSLTGSKADVRMAMRPSGARDASPSAWCARFILQGRSRLARRAGASALDALRARSIARSQAASRAELDALVTRSVRRRRQGRWCWPVRRPRPRRTPPATCLNRMLGAEGKTVPQRGTVARPALASPDDCKRLVDDMAAGRIAVALFWDVNPAYDPGARPTTVTAPGEPRWPRFRCAFAWACFPTRRRPRCNLVLPANHWLESWNDFETSHDALTLQQPVVAPLYDTLAGRGRPLALSGRAWTPAGQDLPRVAQAALAGRGSAQGQPDSPSRDSGIRVPARRCLSAKRRVARRAQAQRRGLRSAASAAAGRKPAHSSWCSTPIRVSTTVATPTTAGCRRCPIRSPRRPGATRLSMSPGDADRLASQERRPGHAWARGRRCPSFASAGRRDGVLRLTLGHGRWQGSVAVRRGHARLDLRARRLARAGHPVAAVRPRVAVRSCRLAQDHDTKDGRDIARVWSLAEFARKPQHELEREELPSLYDKLEHKGPRWGMAIDLSSCVGCGACVVACQSENNIPVVGPEQVRKGRAMHWMRIDRYYEGDETSASPSVVHEPMLCQHCDNAPCETVCPVQCHQPRPRRHQPDGLQPLRGHALLRQQLPVQGPALQLPRLHQRDARVAAARVQPRGHGAPARRDGEVHLLRAAHSQRRRRWPSARAGPCATATWCPRAPSACPASAIVFGDISDPKSEVSKLSRSNRGFRVLEELGTKPAITYLAALRNPSGEEVNR